MSDDTPHFFVLMPCSMTQSWAVPPNSIAEIVTLQATTEQPPEELEWRGQTIPVLDFGFDEDCSWREQLGGTGLIAIFLGLKGEGCDYWGVAVRGEGLAVKRVAAADVEDAPESVLQHATAAFKLDDVIYQVPDLAVFQRKIAATEEVA